MPDLHPMRIPECVEPSLIEPDSKVRLAKDFIIGSCVKDLGRIAAGR
jgi:hypothetical protein